jgi:hypothetical protein
MNTVPICQAKSKRSGEQCCNFAIKGKRVCHLHGGRSTGAKTKEGKIRQKMANIKHGMYTPEAMEERSVFTAMIKRHQEDLSNF